MKLNASPHDLYDLARQIHENLFAGRDGSPPFPPMAELEKSQFDLVFWLSEVHGLGMDVMARLARFHDIPYYPVGQPHPTSAAQELLKTWRASFAVSAQSDYPWVPLHKIGPYLVIGHFSPSCTDLAGLPSRLCIKVLLSFNDYHAVLRDARALLASDELPIPLPGDPEQMDVLDLIATIQVNANKALNFAEQRELVAKDAQIQLIEDLRAQQVPILPHDGLAVDDHSSNAIPREISVREPMICYGILGSTRFVLTPKPTDVYKIQDEINQDDDASSSVRLVGVYCDEASVRALLERDSRALADLTDDDTKVVAAVEGQRIMQLDAPKLSQVAKKELVQEDNVNLFVEWMVYKAIALQCSDIHIERVDTEARVRFRINGSLMEMVHLPLELLPKVLNVLKIYCNMPLIEKRKVLDGGFPIVFGSKRLDARVSMIPHLSEMTCVIRVNSRGTEKLTVDSLRMSPRNRAIMMESVSVRTGIVFITGPTGSGKTTSLYAFLNHLNTPDRNIVTIEEPIEYHIPGLKQFQINRAAELDYKAFFKGILRHDPNVILIGEIRDEETAHQAVVAANTGHLVFATLHTNNAVGVIPRMLGLGVEPSELADALVCVQAQRLVRLLCPHCAKPRSISPEEASMFQRHGMTPPEIVKDSKPGGCRICNGTGYTSRQAIMEVMPAFPRFIDGVVRGATMHELVTIQRELGFRDLFEEGLALAADGLTTIADAGGWKRAFSDFETTSFAKSQGALAHNHQ